MRIRLLTSLAFVALLVAGLVASPVAGMTVPAHAEDDPGPVFTVDAGVRGWHDPGDHVVVTATIESDELFDGRVDVVAASGAVVTRDVQVAGGTTKTVLLVAPTTYDNAALDVRLYRSGELLIRRSVTMKAAETVELVGVLPALETRVGELDESVNLPGELGNAQLIALSPDVLSLGSLALDVYDTIAGTSADLRSLQPEQRAALLGWLNRGGRLLLDDDGDVSALPSEWRPGPEGYALAGRGEVHVVDGKASAGAWASIIEPSGLTSSEYDMFFVGGEQLGAVQDDLARRAGVSLPSLMPLLLPLIVYWVLVAVAVFVVLKAMRRLTLAWVAIPLLAAVTAGAVLLYGNHWRSVGNPAAATFVDGYPGGGDATTSVLTFSRDGGTTTVDLPAGWQSDSEVTLMFGGLFGIGATPRVQAGGDSSRLRVRLEPGQVTTGSVAGPTGDAGLSVTAEVDGGDVAGTVTNTGPVTLHDVAVFGAGGADLVGDLRPGESGTFTFDADPLPLGFGLADRVWNTRRDGTGDSIVEFGIWSNASVGRVMYPSGMVRAAGWTDQRRGDASTSGGLTTTTVVTVTAPIGAGDGVLPEAAVRRSTVRSPFTQFGNGLGDPVYRYVVPPGTGEAMVLELPVELTGIQFWNGSAWIDGTGSGRMYPVPAQAVRSGVVMARFENGGQFISTDSMPSLLGVERGDG